MSNLVRNPEDVFSHVAAHIINFLLSTMIIFIHSKKEFGNVMFTYLFFYLFFLFYLQFYICFWSCELCLLFMLVPSKVSSELANYTLYTRDSYSAN